MLGSKMSLPIVFKDGCQKEMRDPCASPPCKRLKQASIPFQIIIDDKATNNNDNLTKESKQDAAATNLTNDKNLHDNTLSNTSNSSTERDKMTCQDLDKMTLAPSIINNEQSVGMTTPVNNPPREINCNHDIGGILKYTQPVTPGNHSTTTPSKDTESTIPGNHSFTTQSKDAESTIPTTTPSKVTESTIPGNHYITTTPSKDTESTIPSNHSTTTTPTDIVMSTPNNPALSSPLLTTPKQNESCHQTPGNKSQNTTPKSRTPGHKLSVEEKLKKEEEMLKKQKEREQQEQERLEKKKEKERLKMEKEKEKQKKEQEKLEQLALKKQREKERQEKKEQEEKEKQERLDKKEEERKKRDEEKRKKEDEKSLKSEEKRKKEEEQSLKKKKVQNSFVSFFIKKETTSTPKQKEQVKIEAKFQPFELKPFMKLASTKPIKPLSQHAKETLNITLIEQAATSISLIKEELERIKEEVSRERQMIDLTISNVTEDNDDVMIVEDDKNTNSIAVGIKPKLLQFHDNNRPAYFGTWRKKSLSVGARVPFKKDKEIINYEVDSDEEWEEEEPGESLSDSEGEEEGEKDEGEKDEDKEEGENDGFFVPHGYLSDDEGVEKEEEIEEMDCAKENTSGQPKTEDRMERQLAKQKVWETEMKRQFKPMRPIAIGCVWDGENMPSVLKKLEACCLVSASIDPVVKNQVLDQRPKSPCSPALATAYCSTAMPVPEEAMPSLIKLVHGNTNGLHKIMKLFRKTWTLQSKKDDVNISNWEEHCMISKRQLERRISNMAKKERRPVLPKARWYVHDNVLTKYKMEHIPCEGNFDINMEETSPSSSKVHLSNKVKSLTPNIKQFTQNANNVGGESVVTKIAEIAKETVNMDTSSE